MHTIFLYTNRLVLTFYTAVISKYSLTHCNTLWRHGILKFSFVYMKICVTRDCEVLNSWILEILLKNPECKDCIPMKRMKNKNRELYTDTQVDLNLLQQLAIYYIYGWQLLLLLMVWCWSAAGILCAQTVFLIVRHHHHRHYMSSSRVIDEYMYKPQHNTPSMPVNCCQFDVLFSSCISVGYTNGRIYCRIVVVFAVMCHRFCFLLLLYDISNV